MARPTLPSPSSPGEALSHWVWVFGEIAGLRWVVEHEVMAFTDKAKAYFRGMAAGDRAVLYVTRGAHHNPTRDVARLTGLATVLGAPERGEPVVIAGREFAWQLPISIDGLLAERSGPPVAPLAGALSIVRDPAVWGVFFRNSPKRITSVDFAVLAGAIEQAAVTNLAANAVTDLGPGT